MNDEHFLAWLKSPAAIPIVLIEVEARVAGAETTRYLSTGSYVTAPTDTPANTCYEAIVSTGLEFSEQLSLSGEAGLSAGDIEIHNPAGVRDGWANDVWANRPIRAWVGDPGWPRADFRMIFNGIVADIAPKGADKLALKLRDKLQRLNTPVSEAKLGGATPNADALLPLCWGETHNVTPLLSDPGTLEFQVHGGAVERIDEVRANGVPVSATLDNGRGKFTLKVANASAAVTVSLKGETAGGYRNTVAALVQRIVTGYGKAADRFTAADLDSANLAAFEAAHPQPVGLYLSGRTNVLNACQMLANSLGAQIAMSRLGRLRLIQLALPGAGMPTAIHPWHMVDGTLAPTSRTAVAAAVKLGFCKNWTVQDKLDTGIPVQHKDLYKSEWLTTTRADAAVQALYRLDAEPVQQDTLLLRKVEADAEAERRLALWRVPRTIYEFEGTPEMMALELGQAVTLHHRRYGMAGGAPGVVVSLAPNWLNAHVKVGVLV
ncbi:hypothetical protein [Janthinobacterium fluminis]|uniref:Phage tail protein n=1 Tax=Janthinobacterium fluminis TaxID=2987524 RepID=A0ABT5K0T3_9BURK|nr:hypothetical protein [Janthinobacterium fluminis]MDC8758583.1 hypothetical protein [Janthinobacterium fluminis]